MTSSAVLLEQIGDALRLARRRRRLSQRALAAAVGVSKSTIAALETEDGKGSLMVVLAVLHGAGFGLELVDLDSGVATVHEPPPDLRDVVGRRFPAHADERQIRFPHHWWFVRHPIRPRSEWPTWTWKAAAPNMAPLSERQRLREAARAERDTPRDEGDPRDPRDSPRGVGGLRSRDGLAS